MAIIMNVTTNSDLTVENAYIKVSDNININKDAVNRIAYFNVEVYKDADARNGGKSQIQDVELAKVYGFIYNITSTDNIIVQAYKYLKTLELFKDGVDC